MSIRDLFTCRGAKNVELAEIAYINTTRAVRIRMTEDRKASYYRQSAVQVHAHPNYQDDMGEQAGVVMTKE